MNLTSFLCLLLKTTFMFYSEGFSIYRNSVFNYRIESIKCNFSKIENTVDSVLILTEGAVDKLAGLFCGSLESNNQLLH